MAQLIPGILLFIKEPLERLVRTMDESVAYIKEWLDHHQSKIKTKPPLFVKANGRNQGKRLDIDVHEVILAKITLETDTEKRMRTHLFRHSLATRLINSVNENKLRLIMDWFAGSLNAATYVHNSYRGIDEVSLLKEN